MRKVAIRPIKPLTDLTLPLIACPFKMLGFTSGQNLRNRANEPSLPAIFTAAGSSPAQRMLRAALTSRNRGRTITPIALISTNIAKSRTVPALHYYSDPTPSPGMSIAAFENTSTETHLQFYRWLERTLFERFGVCRPTASPLTYTCDMKTLFRLSGSRVYFLPALIAVIKSRLVTCTSKRVCAVARAAPAMLRRRSKSFARSAMLSKIARSSACGTRIPSTPD